MVLNELALFSKDMQGYVAMPSFIVHMFKTIVIAKPIIFSINILSFHKAMIAL